MFAEDDLADPIPYCVLSEVLPITREVVRVVGRLRRRPAVQSTARHQRRTVMTQKIIEVVGTSKESFAKAAENAVAEAAKTVRGMK